jgi:Domain of unknown function (DUF5667)
MTASLRHRRRAERFAQLLEEASGGRRQRRRNPLDEELAELMSLRHRLVETATPIEIDPEFRAGLRAMLVATAERDGIGVTARAEPAEPVTHHARTPVVRPIRAPRARTAVIAGVAVGAVAFAGMSAASENAMPGDALYGVKRSAERAQLALASSDVGRGALYLGFAQTRLAEARLLGDDLDRVLDDMDRDATQGVRLLTTAAASRQDYSALDMVDEFAAEQRTALDLLAAEVTGADADRVGLSLGLLDKIVGRTGQLRDDLDECAGQPVTQLDSLGPVPRDCVALPAPAPLDRQPEQTEATQLPAGQPEYGAPAGGADGSGAPAAPVAPGDAPATSAPDSPAPETPPPAGEDPAVAGEGTETDDGGLLTDLNRLLGNLLGG